MECPHLESERKHNKNLDLKGSLVIIHPKFFLIQMEQLKPRAAFSALQLNIINTAMTITEYTLFQQSK